MGDGPRDLDSPVRHVDQVDTVRLVAGERLGLPQGAFRLAQRQRRVSGQFLVGFQLLELVADLFQVVPELTDALS